MKYYLDTVSIRKLSKELTELKDVCYTSALCVFELISGLRENEFLVRKKAIQNLFDSGIPIIWELPEAMKTYAFPIVEITESRVQGLQKLCFHLVNSENFESFISKTKDEKYSLEFFNHLDNIYSTGFLEATIKGNQTLKQIFAEQRDKHGEAFEKSAKDYVKSLSTNPKNKSITISAIASYLSDLVNKAGDKMEVSELIQCYNGSIDIFIEAFSLFSAQKSSFLDSPAKNDFLDLHHLLYLGNN